MNTNVDAGIPKSISKEMIDQVKTCRKAISVQSSTTLLDSIKKWGTKKAGSGEWTAHSKTFEGKAHHH